MTNRWGRWRGRRNRFLFNLDNFDIVGWMAYYHREELAPKTWN